MRLLRAFCPCGYRTRKARDGYHFYQWRFPIFSTESGTLSDVTATFPSQMLDRLHNQQLEIRRATPQDDPTARKDASARMKRLEEETLGDFILQETMKLRDFYVVDSSHVFAPSPETAFLCPQCRNPTLTLHVVSVIAFCRTDCGHEYAWSDSEVAGCPKCGYRPHRFQTEHEPQFHSEPHTICSCPCSSSTDCISPLDGYCPKCGELPDSYAIAGVNYCGQHHQAMTAYRCPGNFLSMEPDARWVDDQFPNAKLWGDAKPGDKGTPAYFCASCEAEHQRWLQANVD